MKVHCIDYLTLKKKSRIELIKLSYYEKIEKEMGGATSPSPLSKTIIALPLG